MNYLTTKFPTKIKIDDTVYDINADFRNCLRIIEAFEDDSLSTYDKYEIMLRRLYGKIPENVPLAIEKGVQFLDCGEKNHEPINDEKRVYRFSKDGRYIYSAIRQTHNIDLEEVEFLHWWKFVFLFSDINSKCAFANMVYLRDKKNRGKLSKEERAMYLKSLKILDINYDDEPTDAEREFMERLKGG